MKKNGHILTPRAFPEMRDPDLQSYLDRIAYDGGLESSCAVLEALHQAHTTHIPFENLDILLGHPIRLDPESLQDKLVVRRRGGYCFEQNLLFSAVLRKIGFRVEHLSARVRRGSRDLGPRTHMLLRVSAGDQSWLADVGFGADGPIRPVRFVPGDVMRQSAWSHRLLTEGRLWVLQSEKACAWSDLYSFSLEPQEWVDYHMASHYTATHPDSKFVWLLIVQQMDPGARRFLRNRELTIDDGRTVSRRTLTDDEELLEVLDRTFGLAFPHGTRFKYRENPFMQSPVP